MPDTTSVCSQTGELRVERDPAVTGSCAAVVTGIVITTLDRDLLDGSVDVR